MSQRLGFQHSSFCLHPSLGAVFLEGVGDVFEEDEAEDDVLVFRSIHVVAQFIGGEPVLGLEANGGRGLRCCLFRGAGFAFGGHGKSLAWGS